MEKKKIITISREFGSGGRYIGEQIAKKLGIICYDKDIIIKAAEQSGLAEEFIEKKGEYAPKKHAFSYAFTGRNSSGVSVEDYLYSLQRDIILEYAEKESCVIVGRCADYILKDRTDCINVFIHGNQKEKAERIRKLYDKSESEAIKLMKETDKKRSLNYRYYTDREWGRARNYTLCVNSSELGYETCIDMVVELMK